MELLKCKLEILKEKYSRLTSYVLSTDVPYVKEFYVMRVIPNNLAKNINKKELIKELKSALIRDIMNGQISEAYSQQHSKIKLWLLKKLLGEYGI